MTLEEGNPFTMETKLYFFAETSKIPLDKHEVLKKRKILTTSIRLYGPAGPSN